MTAPIKEWTLDELHSLPDDGNAYELIHGELFITPTPTVSHAMIAAQLGRLLREYVIENELGYVFHPHAVFRRNGSEVEPDLMVCALGDPKSDWDAAPTPTLIIEIISPFTHRRDHDQKRAFYLEEAVPEYWIVDGEHRTIRQVRPGHEDILATDSIAWLPPGVGESLTLRVSEVFE